MTAIVYWLNRVLLLRVALETGKDFPQDNAYLTLYPTIYYTKTGSKDVGVY